MKLTINNRHILFGLGACFLVLSVTGCGAADSYSPSIPGGSNQGAAVGLTAAGAQDFGLFRSILDAGEIPAPNTLDDLGFFAEHKLEFPEPDCGSDVCLHGSLGVLGNLMTGTQCTMVMFGMNTPLNPEEMERPPLNLVLAIDTSGSMSGDAIKSVRIGLQLMLDHLEPEDQITLVTYSDEAHVVFEALTLEERTVMEGHIQNIKSGGSTNIYAGLFTAFQRVVAHAHFERQNRVILLSDGIATKGIMDPAKIVSLTSGYASEGIGISAIGVGESFDVELMRAIGEKGAGNFYFLDNAQAVAEVFTDEVNAFMVPVALDVRIHFDVGPGYTVRDAYGTNGWMPGEHGGSIEIPALFIAGRTDDTEPETEGRRGGGGAIVVELMPTALEAEEGDIHEVGHITITWVNPATGELLSNTTLNEGVSPEDILPTEFSQDVVIKNPELPGAWPEGGTFTDKTSEKGFIMLNLYVAFQLAAEAAAAGNYTSALAILEGVRGGVMGWLEENADADITDDLIYVEKFIENLEKMDVAPLAIPEQLPEPWPIGE